MAREYGRKNQTGAEGKSADADRGLDRYSGKRLKLKYKRPPKTSEEAMSTLQEVDARFEVNKSHLVGNIGKLKEDVSMQQKAEQ